MHVAAFLGIKAHIIGKEIKAYTLVPKHPETGVTDHRTKLSYRSPLDGFLSIV